MKRKPRGKDRHDLSRTHASPPARDDGDGSSMSGRIDRARPDLQPRSRCCPRSRLGARYSATVDSARRCTAVAKSRAISRSTAKMSDRSNPLRLSAFRQAKMTLARRRNWPGIDHGDAALERRGVVIHGAAAHGCATAQHRRAGCTGREHRAVWMEARCEGSTPRWPHPGGRACETMRRSPAGVRP